MGSVVVAGQGWMKMLSGEWLGPCQASIARSPPTSEQNSRDASSLSRISSKTVLAESIPDLLRPAVASGPKLLNAAVFPGHQELSMPPFRQARLAGPSTRA